MTIFDEQKHRMHVMNGRYEQLREQLPDAGLPQGYLYTSQPGGSVRWVFGDKTCLSYGEAEGYMSSLLAKAEKAAGGGA